MALSRFCRHRCYMGFLKRGGKMATLDHLSGIGTHVMYSSSVPLGGGKDLLHALKICIFSPEERSITRVRVRMNIMFGAHQCSCPGHIYNPTKVYKITLSRLGFQFQWNYNQVFICAPHWSFLPPSLSAGPPALQGGACEHVTGHPSTIV
jgi:hypothetical protein